MDKLVSKLREKRAKGENGFTLIELLVVVVILGVLIAIAIPLYLNYRKGANDSATQSDMRNTISVMEICQAQTGKYPVLATAGTAPAAPCANQALNLSNGTTMTYLSAAGVSYIIGATNSSGSGKYYCYNSANGGSVRDVTPPTGGTVASGTC